MWQRGWRNQLWSQLDRPWDIVIIGGGITGAGILHEATRQGWRALLVEQRDFAWGTSSRSSKLVHGGLRYLREGRVGLTWASVQERERLLAERPGLVERLAFSWAVYEDDHPGRWVMQAGLSFYDLVASGRRRPAAGRRRSPAQTSFLDPHHFLLRAPHLTQEGLAGGFQYADAETDDARLVLRVIREAVSAGGSALNYVVAEQLLYRDVEADSSPSAESKIQNPKSKIAGVRLRDNLSGGTADVFAKVIINATGAWADRLRQQAGGPPRIRPLRGSHLLFPIWRLPVAQAVSFPHPFDGRPVFIFPWEGVTLVGTTDVDCHEPLDDEPAITPDEVAYLMAAVEGRFPSLHITLDDVLSTYAGVRPVIGTGAADPSEESRDHVVWEENGLLTITGGKLTTFHLIAQDALAAGRDRLGIGEREKPPSPELHAKPLSYVRGLDEGARRRLLGRYDNEAAGLVAAAGPGELACVPGTHTLWAELRWAARMEGVVHLDDLLLRRVRLGLLLPNGASTHLPRIRQICQDELGWDDGRWQAEETAYLSLWRRCYSLPDRAAIPDWRGRLAEVSSRRRAERRLRQQQERRSRWAILLTFLALVVAVVFLLGRRPKPSPER
ncbi:MAG: glycerol-3-phosphate dehydrogenase/oxidase [Chloroflexota bacterium]